MRLSFVDRYFEEESDHSFKETTHVTATQQTIADINWNEEEVSSKRKRSLALELSDNKRLTAKLQHWPSIYVNGESGGLFIKFRYNKTENGHPLL